MKTYELSYIISSRIPFEEADKISKEIESAAQAAEGIILKFEKPVARTLAYPVKKQSSGYFVSLDFQVEEGKIKGIKETAEKNNNILRCFVVAKNPAKELKRKRVREFGLKSGIYGVKEPSTGGEAKKEPVKSEDIDKKLEEILSE